MLIFFLPPSLSPEKQHAMGEIMCEKGVIFFCAFTGNLIKNWKIVFLGRPTQSNPDGNCGVNREKYIEHARHAGTLT
jgi:hypothetical protein